jgi:hypothetical protein
MEDLPPPKKRIWHKRSRQNAARLEKTENENSAAKKGLATQETQARPAVMAAKKKSLTRQPEHKGSPQQENQKSAKEPEADEKGWEVEKTLPRN